MLPGQVHHVGGLKTLQRLIDLRLVEGFLDETRIRGCFWIILDGRTTLEQGKLELIFPLDRGSHGGFRAIECLGVDLLKREGGVGFYFFWSCHLHVSN